MESRQNSYDKKVLALREKDRIKEFREAIHICTFYLALPLWLLFWIADIFLVPERKWEFLAIRAIIIPLSFTIDFFAKKSHKLLVVQAFALIFCFGNAILITILIVMAGEISGPYYSGFYLLAIIGLCFFPWTKLYIILCLILIFGPYYLWASTSSLIFIEWPLFLTHSIFIVSTALISLYIRRFYDNARLNLLGTRYYIREIFMKYFPREIVEDHLTDEKIDELAKDQLETVLEAERRRVTIMCTDLRGFTSKSDREPRPENLLKILNNFCGSVFDIIVKWEGLICEIRGDALLIIFGARDKDQHRCIKCAACSLEIQQAMEEVNRKNQHDRLSSDFEIGIGINDDEVVLGSIGTNKRSGYGIVGQGVNIASRIESVSAGGEVWISESVYKRIRESAEIIQQREVLLKGTGRIPLKIYKLAGLGPPYNITIETLGRPPLKLNYEIPINYSIIKDKEIEIQERFGSILALSEGECEMRFEENYDLLTDVRFNLTEVSNELSSIDCYCKITNTIDDKKRLYRTRITSMPIGIRGYFEAIKNSQRQSKSK